MFVQLASPKAGVYVVSFGGLLVGAIILLPLALARGWSFLATQRSGLLIARSVIGTVQVVALYVAIQSISLVDGVLLRDAAPLWIPVILWLVWRESMPRRLWPGIVLGFVGMAIVLHPNYTSFEIGYVFGLGCGVLFALQSILSRRIDLSGEPVLRTACYIFVTGVVLMAVPAALQWRPAPLEIWIYVGAGGVLVLCSTVCLLASFLYAPAYVLAPFSYSAVVFSALIDWWVFDRPPSGWTILGAVLITVAGILIIKLSRPRAEET
jgi:drug/metabolite transporter (DMT)-like permease